MAPITARRWFAAPLLSATLLPAAPLLADAADGADGAAMDERRTMESIVVTATRIEESLLDVTEAVSVIDADEIRRWAPDVVAEMLRGVPGTFFQQTTPGQGIPIIRGLKGSQVLHLVDGMRLNNAFFRDAPNQYLGLVDSYAIRATEVIRGSAPSLYGADAMGGVLQILTREPVFEDTQWQADGRLYGSFNSADSSLVGRAEGAAGTATTVISGGITYRDHGDRRTGGGETVRPSGYRADAADIKFQHDLGERSEIMLSAQYLEQPSTPRVDELVPGFGQDEPSSERYEFRPNRREFLHARYRLESESSWFQRFEAHLARQVMTDDRLTQDFGDPEFTEEFNESVLDGLTLQFNSPWGGGVDMEHELVWGAEYYTDEISSSRWRFAGEGAPATPRRGRFPDGSTMDSAAVYAYNHWRLDRLTVDAGLRYSAFRIFLPASGEIGDVRLTPSDLTGDIHLKYEVRPGVHLLSNIGRGFRPPNIFDLGTLGSRPGNRFNVPNPSLQPESVWSYDVGIKLAQSKWEAEVYLWYADYRDKISSRFTGDVTPEGRQVVRSDNLNEAQLYGVESGVRYLSESGLDMYAVVNYTRGEESEPGGATAPADRIPPLNGRIGLVWIPNDRLRIEPFLDFAGRQDRLSPRDVDDPRINPFGTAGWVTMNLLASWQVNEGLELGLKLRNLGDKNYREHGSGIDAPGRSLGVWFDARFP
jgi:outer membrane receptor protein involved in Fe transport